MTHTKHYYYTRIDDNNIATIVTACSKKQMNNGGINLKHEWVRFPDEKKANSYISENDGTLAHRIDVTTFNY